MRDKAYEIIESLNRFRRKVLGGEELKAFLCINAFIGQKFVVEEDYECGFIHNMSMNRARKLGLKVSLSNKYVIPRGSELILRKKYRNMYVFTLKGFDITINDFRYLYLSSDDNMLSTSEFASEDEANEFIRNHGITDYEIHVGIV